MMRCKNCNGSGGLNLREGDFVIPAQAGIQYTASSRFHHWRLGVLDARLRGHDKMDIPPRSRDTMRPSFGNNTRPKKKRAQGRPGARCTRGLACKSRVENAHEHTGSAEAVRPSLRNGFTAYFVLSPARPGLLVTVARVKRELLKNLTPAIGASGPHDFAVRISRARQSQLSRPPLPAPTSVTMANVPSLGTGWRGIRR